MPALKQTSRLLSVPQAAEELGISINTIRAWIYRRMIALVKIGRSVRVSEETVQRIIDRGTMPALEDRARQHAVTEQPQAQSGQSFELVPENEPAGGR